MVDDIELSRRTILAGLGAVGAAGAGAGLGTSALFSDTESFENSVITAGELDLLVDYYSYWDQGMAGSGTVSGTADGGTVTGELTDVKPGDSGALAFCPRIETNPAYLWLCGDLTANDENTVTEPEADADAEDDDETDAQIEGQGELADTVLITVSYCDLGEVGEQFDPAEDVLETTEIGTGTLGDFLALVERGVPLDGSGATGAELPFPAPGAQECFAGTGDEAESPCLCIEWAVPSEVGNEIQSDSIEFDLTFFAQQCRNADGTSNPCCPCGPDEVAVDVGGGTSECVPVWTGDESVADFYDWSPHASENPAIQDENATNLLVYEDGGGQRHLVVVHDVSDGVIDGSDATGGTVSATVSGLEPGYSWQVRDDDPGNDTYSTIDSPTETVDWTWSRSMTDGGALGPLAPDFDVGVDLELTDGIDAVQYQTPSGDATVIADGLSGGDTVSTTLSACPNGLEQPQVEN